MKVVQIPLNQYEQYLAFQKAQLNGHRENLINEIQHRRDMVAALGEQIKVISEESKKFEKELAEIDAPFKDIKILEVEDHVTSELSKTPKKSSVKRRRALNTYPKDIQGSIHKVLTAASDWLTTREIIDALTRAGVNVNYSQPVTAIGNILTKMQKDNPEVYLRKPSPTSKIAQLYTLKSKANFGKITSLQEQAKDAYKIPQFEYNEKAVGHNMFPRMKDTIHELLSVAPPLTTDQITAQLLKAGPKGDARWRSYDINNLKLRIGSLLLDPLNGFESIEEKGKTYYSNK